MIQLYQFSTSPFAEKIRRALHYKGLTYSIHEVDRRKAREGGYSDVSPTGKFPAIQDGETIVWDSTDIIFYLEKNYINNPLVPTDPRLAAEAHAIEEWADESLYFYEMTMRLTWEHNLDAALDEFAETMPNIPKDQLRPLIIQSASELTSTQGIGRKPREQVVADVNRHFEHLEGLLTNRDWLVGESLTYADLAVISQINALLYATEARSAMTDKVHIQPWIDRINSHTKP